MAFTAPDAQSLADQIWDSLHQENKISLYVCYRDLSSGQMDTDILNKHQ